MVDAGQPWRTTIGDNLVYTDWGRDNFLVALKEVIGDDVSAGETFSYIYAKWMVWVKSISNGGLDLFKEVETVLKKISLVPIYSTNEKSKIFALSLQNFCQSN